MSRTRAPRARAPGLRNVLLDRRALEPRAPRRELAQLRSRSDILRLVTRLVYEPHGFPLRFPFLFFSFRFKRALQNSGNVTKRK